MTTDQLLAEAMSLSEKERERLAEQLWRTLEHADSDDVDAAWMEEVARREAPLARGETVAVTVEEAIARVAARKWP